MATFLKNINMTSRAWTLFLDGQMAKISTLNGYHAKYVLAVCNNPGISQDALAAILFVHKSNVARQLARLEGEGYTLRKPDPNDRRVSLVYPTQKAMELFPKIREMNARWREVITEGFSEEEGRLLQTLTDRMYQNAERFMRDKKGEV